MCSQAPLVSSGLPPKYIQGIFYILAQNLTFRELISILAKAAVAARVSELLLCTGGIRFGV